MVETDMYSCSDDNESFGCTLTSQSNALNCMCFHPVYTFIVCNITQFYLTVLFQSVKHDITFELAVYQKHNYCVRN